MRMMLLAGVTLLLTGVLAEPQANPADIDDWRGKTVLVFVPHPDDELALTGTLTKLIKGGNTVYLVQVTNGDKGSRDPRMTSQRIAAIRHQEDLAAGKAIGLRPENILWLGYQDGELEYAPQRELVEKVCRLVRKYRPDAIFTMDPGAVYTRWIKIDHRMTALVTVDGVRAAAYPLYFPAQRIKEGLQPFTAREVFFWNSDRPNYRVDITSVIDQKLEAAYQHTSQAGKGNLHYTGSEMDPVDRATVRARHAIRDNDERIYESFRRLENPLAEWNET